MIYEYANYKAFLRDLIRRFPRRGRGQSRQLAEHLGVAPIVVSQVLARDRHFTVDQILKVSEFFGLDEKSSEYLILLVSRDRAETKSLKSFYTKKLEALKKETLDIKNLVQGRDALTEAEKGVFYSNWIYTGVVILTSIDGYQTVEAIADYYGLSRAKVGEIVEFLVSCGLVLRDEKGRLSPGRSSTHIDAKHPLVNNHRRNWRDKAREKFLESADDDYFYSSPMSLSRRDADSLKKELLNLIKTFSNQVADSKSEVAMCLNIDWFKF